MHGTGLWTLGGPQGVKIGKTFSWWGWLLRLCAIRGIRKKMEELNMKMDLVSDQELACSVSNAVDILWDVLQPLKKDVGLGRLRKRNMTTYSAVLSVWISGKVGRVW